MLISCLLCAYLHWNTPTNAEGYYVSSVLCPPLPVHIGCASDLFQYCHVHHSSQFSICLAVLICWLQRHFVKTTMIIIYGSGILSMSFICGMFDKNVLSCQTDIHGNYLDSKVHGAHLGPVGPRWPPCWPMNLAIRVYIWHKLFGNIFQFDTNCPFIPDVSIP